MGFEEIWAPLAPIGRQKQTGGYRRFAWTSEDAQMREWFADAAGTRGLSVTRDRAANLWAWWGDPDDAVSRGCPGVVAGSHLDSVPDGGAFDGPLGIVCAFLAVDLLRSRGFQPRIPIGVVLFGEEEGARFGVPCAGSRLLTGMLSSDRGLALKDADGVQMAEAMARAGVPVKHVGRDDETLRRIGTFVELHIEQGRALCYLDRPIAVGTQIWPHGRWRIDISGEANHAGTTAFTDRCDPMLKLAEFIIATRRAAETHSCLATVGKVRVMPNGVNAIPASITAWLDARGAEEASVRQVVEDIATAANHSLVEESWTGTTNLDARVGRRIAKLLLDAPELATGAGHDAGTLAEAGISTAMLFVRNPTGVSHSPAEHAELDDCLSGVTALADTLAELAA